MHMVIDKEVVRKACARGLPIGEWVPKQQGGRFHELAWIVRPPLSDASARSLLRKRFPVGELSYAALVLGW